MRLLFLCQVLPYPLDAGPKSRVYHVLQYLTARHDVTLVAFTRDSDSPQALAHIQTLCPSCHLVPMRRTHINDALSAVRSLASGKPVTILRDERPEMNATLSHITSINAFDAIHADQLSMAQYALFAQKQSEANHPGTRPMMVLDAHNAYYLIPGRLAQVAGNLITRLFWKREAQLVARYEASTYNHFDHLLTVTEVDQRHIRELFCATDKAPHFTNIPICVDAKEGPFSYAPDARSLLLLGGLHWPPNADAAHWFLSEIWPLVRHEVNNAQLFIIGQRPSAQLRAYGDYPGINLPDQLRNTPVLVTGYVEDTAPYIRASAALLVPLRSGGGMRVKIIDALNWGLPVISTTIGCEGINVTHGHNILIADTPTDFAHAIIDLLRSPELRVRLSKNGRRLIEREYDWQSVYKAFDSVYR